MCIVCIVAILALINSMIITNLAHVTHQSVCNWLTADIPLCLKLLYENRVQNLKCGRLGGRFSSLHMIFSSPFGDQLHMNKNVDEDLGGCFKYFLFSSLFGEDSHFDEYFSDGLKPPASDGLKKGLSRDHSGLHNPFITLAAGYFLGETWPAQGAPLP